MAVLALADCANSPAPHEQMRLTEQAITQAKAVGATTDSTEMASQRQVQPDQDGH